MLTSTLGIFLDISKAFETIGHKLLCHKLQHYGIRDTAFRGSKAILRTGLNFSSLSPLNLTIGNFVWRATRISLRASSDLFIVYINDLPNVSSLTQSLLFADDTNIFCSHRNTDHIVSIANNNLAKIVTWLKAKKLSLSLTKMNVTTFHPRQKKILMSMFLLLNKTL